jgi:hypothetical protein
MLLRHGATLKTLNLTNSINNLSIVGWQALFQLLQDPSYRLEKLDLSHNFIISDEVAVAAALSNALANNSRLRELDFSYSIDVCVTGWEAFLTVVCNPNTAWI